MRIVRMEYGSAGLRCPALPVYIRIINAVMMISPPMQNMCMGVCSDRSVVFQLVCLGWQVFIEVLHLKITLFYSIFWITKTIQLIVK